MKSGNRDPHDGSHAPEQGPVIVGQDLQVPGMSTTGRIPGGWETKLLSSSPCPGVNGALLDLKETVLRFTKFLEQRKHWFTQLFNTIIEKYVNLVILFQIEYVSVNFKN